MSKHTPGPWRAVNAYERIEIVGPVDSGAIIARMCDHGILADGPDQTEANARRIVSVVNSHDDLLAALEEAADYLECIPESSAGGDDEAIRICKKARALLAKVNG
jgi:hypothetical protein